MDLTMANDSDRHAKYLLVIVPCLDEENTVADVVRNVPTAIPGIGRVEVVVIDDGSTDATAERAREAGAEVLDNGANRGLGWSFHKGVDVALARGADILVNIDGDGQFDPADIRRLVKAVLEDGAQMATASRFLSPELTPQMPAIKKWGNHWVARVVWLLTGERFRDVSCGFRAFSSESLLRLNLFGSFTHTQEAFLDLVFKELPIVEVPMKVRGTREFGESRIASSIPRYAARSLQIMVRAFISYRPFIFLSAIASVFLAVGLGLLVFLATHYLSSGAFSPHIWSGFVGGSFSLLGLSTLTLGIIGEVLVRIRMNQERILYFLKRTSWEQTRRGVDRSEGEPL
jgi:glycosyltransferase involved in cell wall biosynthesis